MDVLLLDCRVPEASRRAYKKPTSTEFVSCLHLRGRNPSFFLTARLPSLLTLLWKSGLYQADRVPPPTERVTEPPKLLGPPTVVLVQQTLDNPVDAHNHSTSSVSVSSFPRPRAFHPSRRYYNTSEERISKSELQ
jgi:hypothetical protein